MYFQSVGVPLQRLQVQVQQAQMLMLNMCRQVPISEENYNKTGEGK